jgi:hypothetical protein
MKGSVLSQVPCRSYATFCDQYSCRMVAGGLGVLILIMLNQSTTGSILTMSKLRRYQYDDGSVIDIP